MTLLALMYHRAKEDPHGNAPEMLDAHFAHVVRHCRCVLPGEDLASARLNVCLTFDDAYSDFHSIVVPLLQRHGLKALVAVVPGFIEEASTRGSKPDSPPPDYCSWQQLREAISTGCVEVAAHGLNHVRLDSRHADLNAEIVMAGNLLSARLGRGIHSFVLPYGRFSASSLELARRHYRYVFRIGGADNAAWNPGLIYRVNADAMRSPDGVFRKSRLLSYRIRRHWNRMRAR